MIALSFCIGFIMAIIIFSVVMRFAYKFVINKGWYASAICSEKQKKWLVRGQYLMIGSKILNSIRAKDGKVKYTA
ncbi:hypothetical protein [Escherichia phage EC125]|nr:hypothetical protein [Escherichia phage EC125]URC25707.1 hypothetical protein [Escherichia phage EC195]